MTDPRAAERTFPLPGPINTGQFTRVVYAVEQALVAAGYPKLTEADTAELAVALGRFVHGVR